MFLCCDLSQTHVVRCEVLFSWQQSHAHNLLRTKPFQNLDFQMGGSTYINAS